MWVLVLGPSYFCQLCPQALPNIRPCRCTGRKVGNACEEFEYNGGDVLLGGRLEMLVRNLSTMEVMYFVNVSKNSVAS